MMVDYSPGVMVDQVDWAMVTQLIAAARFKWAAAVGLWFQPVTFIPQPSGVTVDYSPGVMVAMVDWAMVPPPTDPVQCK
jgi:hypothetical protein